jgi:hypothetical protein
MGFSALIGKERRRTYMNHYTRSREDTSRKKKDPNDCYIIQVFQ